MDDRKPQPSPSLLRTQHIHIVNLAEYFYLVETAMADQASEQPKDYDQRQQSIYGPQTNLSGAINTGSGIFNTGTVNILTAPTPRSLIFQPVLQSLASLSTHIPVAVCLSIIISISARFIGLHFDIWHFIVTFGFVLSLSFNWYDARTRRREEQARQDQARRQLYTRTLFELEDDLTDLRWKLSRLMSIDKQGKTLTLHQHDQWSVYKDTIDLVKSLIEKQGGIPKPSDHDSLDPPPLSTLFRVISWLTALISSLISISLIVLAVAVGSATPWATERLVVELIDLLPIPSPTPMPLPTLTPTTTVAPTLMPTVTATVTPTTLPPATVTPTVVRILAPTDTMTPAPTLASTLSAEPLVVATIVPTPSPSTTITSPLSIEPRTRFQPPTATPVELTATSTPTPTLTVAIGALSGYIAYPVFNGAEYDTVVRDLTTNTIVYRVYRARQPDFRGGGYLLVNREGGSLLRVDIHRADERPVTERDEDARPHWAPGDDRIVFESFEQDKNATILKLQVNSTLQSNPPYLHSPTGGTIRGRNAIFLGDGRIAFNGCAASWNTAASGDCGIWSINTDGSGIIRLTDQPRDYPTDNFGSQILFTSDRNSNWDVYITNAPLQERPLTTDPARDGLATASPDGNYIAFVSDYGGQWAIWVMQADGSGRRPLIAEDVAFGTGNRDWTTEKISWGQ